MTATDQTALLSAICDHPREDTPRLAYADWLDEQGDVRVPCPRCKAYRGIDRVLGEHGYAPPMRECTFCGGTGTVVGTANADRAEFIRVQVELARGHQNSECASCRKRYPTTWKHWDKQGCCPGRAELLRRERELLRQYADAWRPEVLREKCGLCKGEGVHRHGYVKCDIRGIHDTRGEIDCVACKSSGFAIPVVFTRGFVSHVTCTAAQWTADRERRADAGECPRCEGTGRRPCARHKSGHECPACSGTGRRTRGDGFAARVVLACPVAGVTLSDREPLQLGSGVSFGWYDPARGGVSEDRATVPSFLWGRLTGYEGGNYYGRLYPTPDAAHRALSDACVAWARAEARLSP